MAQSRLELVLAMKDRMTGAMTRAKEAVASITNSMETSFDAARSRIGQSVDGIRSKIRQFGSETVDDFEQVKAAVPKLVRAVELLKNPLLIVTTSVSILIMGFHKLRAASNRWMEDSNAQNVTVSKLAKVMQNTMNATPAQVKSMLELASAQQKIGVIGDEVTIAGMQQLAMSIKNTDTLKKLTPVMDDFIAKEYGLNATQENAVAVASLFQKAMNGQTGILKRNGILLSAAQEKALEHGNEQQRAAVIIEAFGKKVNGMNEALANTPEGKIKQVQNDMGDLREDAGKIAIDLKTALLPFFEFLQRSITTVLTWATKHSTEIKSVIGTVMNFLMTAIRRVYNVLNFLWSYKEVILGMAVAFMVWSIWTHRQVIATRAMTVAQWLLNTAMNANLIGIIIVAIGALIGIIVLLSKRYSGWGTLFKAIGVTIVNYLKQLLANWKFVFQEMWFVVQLVWLRLKSFAQYIGQLFTNIGKAMKEALKGNFTEARDILKQKITTDAEVEIKKVEKQRSDNREKFKDESLARAKEVVDAWKAVKITKNAKEEKSTETPQPEYSLVGGAGDGNNTETGGGSTEKDITTGVAGSAGQIRNITVNIGALNKGGINMSSTETAGKSGSEVEDYFNQMLLRVVRNLELSY